MMEKKSVLEWLEMYAEAGLNLQIDGYGKRKFQDSKIWVLL